MPAKLTGEKLARQQASPIYKYLNRVYLDWQSKTGGAKSRAQFAEHLGMKNAAFHKLWSGETVNPKPETLAAIAAKLGDEIYSVVGVERPDNVKRFINENWGMLDVDTVSEINRIVERAISRASARTSTRSVAAPDRRGKVGDRP